MYDHEKRADEIIKDERTVYLQACAWARERKSGAPVVGTSRPMENFDDGEVKLIAVGGVGVFSVYSDGAVRCTLLGQPNTPFGSACRAYMTWLLETYAPGVLKAKVVDRTGSRKS